MTSAQMSLALFARDVGMARVERSAGTEWQRLALGYLSEYVARHLSPFLAEDVREWAEARGLPAPPNEKAWGPVMQAARRAGIVWPCGYAPARSSNGAPKVRWEAAR